MAGAWATVTVPNLTLGTGIVISVVDRVGIFCYSRGSSSPFYIPPFSNFFFILSNVNSFYIMSLIVKYNRRLDNHRYLKVIWLSKTGS